MLTREYAAVWACARVAFDSKNGQPFQTSDSGLLWDLDFGFRVSDFGFPSHRAGIGVEFFISHFPVFRALIVGDAP